MIVVIKLGLLSSVISGMAIRAVTGLALTTPNIVLRCPLDIVGDEQVEPTVLVIVKPSCAG